MEDQSELSALEHELNYAMESELRSCGLIEYLSEPRDHTKQPWIYVTVLDPNGPKQKIDFDVDRGITLYVKKLPYECRQLSIEARLHGVEIFIEYVVYLTEYLDEERSVARWNVYLSEAKDAGKVHINCTLCFDISGDDDFSLEELQQLKADMVQAKLQASTEC